MGRPVRINDALYRELQARALAEKCTIESQLNFWARLGKTALDNPDLPTAFVKNLLIARAEDQRLATHFTPEGKGVKCFGLAAQAISRNGSDTSK